MGAIEEAIEEEVVDIQPWENGAIGSEKEPNGNDTIEKMRQLRCLVCKHYTTKSFSDADLRALS